MNASKIREHVLVFVLLVTWLLGGCASGPLPIADGQVLELGRGASEWGVQAALRGAANTHIISDGKLTLLLWPQGGGWGFACLNGACKDPVGCWRYITGGRAMAANWRTVSDLVNDLTENYGWKSIPAAAVTQGQAVGAWITSVSASLTTFFVLPVITPPADMLEQQS